MPTNLAQVIGLFSSDLVFLATIFVVFLVYGLYFGKSKIISLILSFYPTTYLYHLFPYVEKLVVLKGDKLIFLNKVGIFLLFFIPISIVVNRYVFADSFTGNSNMLKCAGLSFACLLLFVLWSYTTINIDAIHTFSPQIAQIFDSGPKIFYFNLLPIVLLAFL